MITIQVVATSTGKPVKDIKVGVAIGNDGTFFEFTNSSGEAHFAKVSPGEYYYYVNHKEFKGQPEGRKVVYI